MYIFSLLFGWVSNIFGRWWVCVVSIQHVTDSLTTKINLPSLSMMYSFKFLSTFKDSFNPPTQQLLSMNLLYFRTTHKNCCYIFHNIMYVSTVRGKTSLEIDRIVMKIFFYLILWLHIGDYFTVLSYLASTLPYHDCRFL